MHFHHYSLQHLSDYLNEQAAGQHIGACLSQNKNELIVVLEELYLRIGCHTPLTYVVPLGEFAKARKNVVELFPEVVGRSLQQARVVPWERILILELEGEAELILKMHGSRANVLLRQAGKIVRLLNQQLEADLSFREQAGPFDAAAIEAPLAPTASLPEVMARLNAISPIFEKQFARKIHFLMQQGVAFAQAFRQVQQQALEPDFFVVKEANRMRFLLFSPVEAAQAVRISGIQPALSFFLRTHFQYEHYRQQYHWLEKHLQKPLSKYEKVYQSYRQNIARLESERSPEEIGHLLMANLHQIPPGSEEVVLQDFYQNKALSIRLQPNLSPQDNAQRYYEKHKQRKGKLQYLKSQLADIARKREAAAEKLAAFRQIPPPQELPFDQQGFDPHALKALKKLMKQYRRQEKESETQRYPFRTFEKDGYQIFVGKSGKNNDQLSFQFARREDLWLHAKDVAGSHVIIRQKPGQNVPQPVLEYAAQLAAFYSKAKNDSLVPVIYTPRKYVRKRKGDAPGQVAVMREQVIMVPPVRE